MNFRTDSNKNNNSNSSNNKINLSSKQYEKHNKIKSLAKLCVRYAKNTKENNRKINDNNKLLQLDIKKVKNVHIPALKLEAEIEHLLSVNKLNDSTINNMKNQMSEIYRSLMPVSEHCYIDQLIEDDINSHLKGNKNG